MKSKNSTKSASYYYQNAVGKTQLKQIFLFLQKKKKNKIK